MNKPLIVTIAVVIFLLALGSWVYLFFFGAPQNPDEFFTDLGITLDEQAVVPVTNSEKEPTEQLAIDVASNPLQQLTVRPVAGFVGVDTNQIRYVEQGTGHVYELNLNSGEEVRLSNTTLPQITNAVFNTTGEQVILQTANNNQLTIVATIENGGLSTSNLPPQAQNLIFIGTSTVAYTLASENRTIGYKFDTASESQVTDFVVPFTAIKTHYIGDNIYVTNRHAPELEGALWQVTGSTLKQVGSSEFGLTVEFGPTWYALAFTQNNEYVSSAVQSKSGELFQLPVHFVPEKCDWDVETLWCASTFADVPHTYLKDWYQGVTRADDALWKVDPVNETATLVVHPTTEIGRQLDVTELQHTDDKLLFINRQDNTLWLYDDSSR